MGLPLAVAVTVLGLFAWSLARSAPPWWRQYRPEDARLLERAKLVEDDATSRLFDIRPRAHADGPYMSALWGVGITDDDASAWLTARLPLWLDGQVGLPPWPDELTQMQVQFGDGVARVAVRIREDGDDAGRIVTTTLRPDIDETGAVWLRPTWVHLGRLPVPASWVLSRAERDATDLLSRSADEQESAALFGVLRGRSPLAEDPVIGLDAGRQVRLVGLRIRDGRLELTCRTEGRLASR